MSVEEEGLRSSNCSSKDGGTNNRDRDVGREEKPVGGEKGELGGGPYLWNEFCFSRVVFEEMVIHAVGNIQYVVRKMSLELGRTGNKDLAIKVVVAEVIEEDKT